MTSDGFLWHAKTLMYITCNVEALKKKQTLEQLYKDGTSVTANN